MEKLEKAINGFMNFEITKTKFMCNKHGEVFGNKIVGDKDFYVCPMCELEDSEKEKAEQKKNERKNLEYEYKEKNIEPEYWDKELNDFKCDTKSQLEAFDTVKELIEKKEGKVILLGSNGVGKTFLGSMVIKKLGGKIFSMYEISTMIRQSYSVKAEKTELDIVNELASIPMLVIDEMGRTKGSKAELDWLSYILDKRHTRKLPFMILSNTHLRRDCKNKGCDMCFENYLNNDVLSRLRQNTKIITINAPDYRARGNND